MDTQHLTLSIEGNISCGKTTLITQLQQHFNCEIIYEPVDEWLSLQNKQGKNILESFYEDQTKYAYLFQMNAYITRAKQLNKPQTQPIRFLDRSVLADKIFASLCYENGHLNEFEWLIYNTWYDWLNTEFEVNRKINGIIYLQCDPSTSKTRISKRDRSGEQSITSDYLQKISDKHNTWLSSIDIPTLTLDANQDFEHNPQILTNYVNSIKDFITTLHSKV